MVAADNLTSLHQHEEELRAKSLAAIEADVAPSNHWNLVGEAMNAIYVFTHDHAHGSDNEVTLHTWASGSSSRGNCSSLPAARLHYF
jgi:hypothetical protein